MTAFTLGEVLSITTGRLLCPIDGVYRILNHLTGESLYTHQLGRAMFACRPYILELYPPLSAIDADADGVNSDNWKEWLAGKQKEYADLFPLPPMPQGRYLGKEPLEELREMIMVCHHCDNANCVNPLHLFTGRENHRSEGVAMTAPTHYCPACKVKVEPVVIMRDCWLYVCNCSGKHPRYFCPTCGAEVEER